MFERTFTYLWTDVPTIIIWFCVWNLLVQAVNYTTFTLNDPVKERQKKVMAYAILLILFLLIINWS